MQFGDIKDMQVAVKNDQPFDGQKKMHMRKHEEKFFCITLVCGKMFVMWK